MTKQDVQRSCSPKLALSILALFAMSFVHDLPYLLVLGIGFLLFKWASDPDWSNAIQQHSWTVSLTILQFLNLDPLLPFSKLTTAASPVRLPLVDATFDATSVCNTCFSPVILQELQSQATSAVWTTHFSAVHDWDPKTKPLVGYKRRFLPATSSCD
jgi:hypothetical protein